MQYRLRRSSLAFAIPLLASACAQGTGVADAPVIGDRPAPTSPDDGASPAADGGDGRGEGGSSADGGATSDAGGGSDASATNDAGNVGPGPGGGSSATGVAVHLEKTLGGAEIVSFGLPVPPGAVADAARVRVTAGGAPLTARVRATLFDHDAQGAKTAPRALVVQFPASEMSGQSMDVQVEFAGGSGATSDVAPFAQTSAPSDEVVTTADRTIESVGGKAQLTVTATHERKLFSGREPAVLATFPAGYLASTGILGEQVTAADTASPDLAGLSFFSDNLKAFALSAMYDESYPVSSYEDTKDPLSGSVVDPIANYEGWLYDRCATFLTAYSHTGDARFLRHAYRACSWYSGQIELSGENRGIFKGKSTPDTKYSHLRGLYAYYALTGDEGALASGTAIADMWESEPYFVVPYRAGHLRGEDKLWTERLLGTSLEGLWYGAALTGQAKYLTAFGEMLTTAYAHITGDAAALKTVNPYNDFPPQDCFIHSAAQHAEGNTDEPWCSGWMSELTLDALLRYQAQTGDARVDEIFVRMARFLRDTGSSYFDKNPIDDSFLSPSTCYDPSRGESVRRLIPLYGSGRVSDGTRRNYGEYDDSEHCADATALTAAAMRALKRQGTWDEHPVGPFASEGASFLAMHHEFAACADLAFQGWSRTGRDPASWTSSQLQAGLSNPQSFLVSNKIGFPSHPTSPNRKLSWWFNMSMLQFGMLRDAGIAIPALLPGQVQKAGCP